MGRIERKREAIVTAPFPVMGCEQTDMVERTQRKSPCDDTLCRRMALDLANVTREHADRVTLVEAWNCSRKKRRLSSASELANDAERQSQHFA